MTARDVTAAELVQFFMWLRKNGKAVDPMSYPTDAWDLLGAYLDEKYENI